VNLLNAAEGATNLGQWDDARAALTALRQRDSAQSTPDPARALRSGAGRAQRGHCPCLRVLEATADADGTEDMTARANNHLARAEVYLATGDLEAAHQHASAALAAEPSGINSAAALAIQQRAALWLGDLGRARRALTDMRAFRGRWMAAVRLTAEAGLAALEGRHDEAATAYARALDAWRAIDSPLDLALCALEPAMLRGSDVAREDDDDEAREIFTRIEARPFLARLDRAVAAARKGWLIRSGTSERRYAEGGSPTRMGLY